MRGPRDWSIMPNPTFQEGSCDSFLNVKISVWENPILLVDDVWLQIRYLGVQKLLQHVKIHATRYCGFHKAKWLNNPVFH
jgi:hypothetical protein